MHRKKWCRRSPLDTNEFLLISEYVDRGTAHESASEIFARRGWHVVRDERRSRHGPCLAGVLCLCLGRRAARQASRMSTGNSLSVTQIMIRYLFQCYYLSIADSNTRRYTSAIALIKSSSGFKLEAAEISCSAETFLPVANPSPTARGWKCGATAAPRMSRRSPP